MNPAPWPASRLALPGLLLWAAVLGGFSAAQAIDNDQGLFYTAALRVAQGQQMLVDFGMPYAYFTVQVLAFFFWLAATSGWGLVAASATLNLAATGVATSALVRAGAGQWGALAGGWLVSLGFLAIGGMYYNDQFAYFFVLLAAWAWLALARPWPRSLVVGACLVAAFYAKQPVGLAGLGGLAAALALTHRWDFALVRASLPVAASYALGHAGMVAWAYWALDFPTFTFFYWDLPLDYKAHESGWTLLKALLLPLRIDPLLMLRELGLGRLLLYPYCLLTYLAYFLIAQKIIHKDNWGNPSLFLLAYVLISTLLANGLVGRGNAELNLGLGVVVPLVLAEWRPGWWRWAGLALFSSISLVLIVQNRRLTNSTSAHLYADTPLRPLQFRRLFAPQEDADFHALNRKFIDFLQRQPPGATLAALDYYSYLVPLAVDKAPLVATSDYLHAFHYMPLDHPLQPKAQADLLRRFTQSRPDFVLRVAPGSEQFKPGALAQLEAYLAQHYQPVLQDRYYLLLARKK
jgi:hypothetical protein